MSASPAALAALVQTNVNSRMTSVRNYPPLSQGNPSFYIQFCKAIGQGLILGNPNIDFNTQDTGDSGVPLVQGIGIGTGIMPDASFFIENLYTRIMNYIHQDLGNTLHDPYPPRQGNSGQFLLALCLGINDSIQSYYPTAWTLNSIHPQIYEGSGIISNGNFIGMSASAIQASIISGAPNFVGRFWPRLAQAIAESYVELIEQHSTGMVTISGSCGGDGQQCGIPGSGAGTGVAT